MKTKICLLILVCLLCGCGDNSDPAIYTPPPDNMIPWEKPPEVKQPPPVFIPYSGVRP